MPTISKKTSSQICHTIIPSGMPLVASLQHSSSSPSKNGMVSLSVWPLPYPCCNSSVTFSISVSCVTIEMLLQSQPTYRIFSETEQLKRKMIRSTTEQYLLE